MTYEISFTDGEKLSIVCDKIKIDGGIIYFYNSSGDVLSMANMFSNIKYIILK